MKPYVASGMTGLGVSKERRTREEQSRAEPDSTPPEGQNGRRSALGPVGTKKEPAGGALQRHAWFNEGRSSKCTATAAIEFWSCGNPESFLAPTIKSRQRLIKNLRGS